MGSTWGALYLGIEFPREQIDPKMCIQHVRVNIAQSKCSGHFQPNHQRHICTIRTPPSLALVEFPSTGYRAADRPHYHAGQNTGARRRDHRRPPALYPLGPGSGLQVTGLPATPPIPQASQIVHLLSSQKAHTRGLRCQDALPSAFHVYWHPKTPSVRWGGCSPVIVTTPEVLSGGKSGCV